MLDFTGSVRILFDPNNFQHLNFFMTFRFLFSSVGFKRKKYSTLAFIKAFSNLVDAKIF